MNTFVTILGWICLVAICLAVLAFAVALAADMCRRALEQFRWTIHANTMRELGTLIRSGSHWFGESKEAWMALNILGQRLEQGLAIHPDQWREEWRSKIGPSQGEGSAP